MFLVVGRLLPFQIGVKAVYMFSFLIRKGVFDEEMCCTR